MRKRLLVLLPIALALAGCGDASTSDTDPGSLPDLGLESASDARECLIAAGLQVTGAPRAPNDRNAPDVELIVNAGPLRGTFIAFYRSEARAERYEPQIARNAARFDGSVKRSGNVTLLYIRQPNGGDKAIIEGCAFG